MAYRTICYKDKAIEHFNTTTRKDKATICLKFGSFLSYSLGEVRQSCQKILEILIPLTATAL